MNVRMLKDIYSHRDVPIEFLDSVGDVPVCCARWRELIAVEELSAPMFVRLGLLLLLSAAICSCKVLGLLSGGGPFW